MDELGWFLCGAAIFMMSLFLLMSCDESKHREIKADCIIHAAKENIERCDKL